MRIYRLRKPVWRVKDEEGVDFHVKEKDYFATLAAILRLWKSRDRQTAMSRQEVEKDLLYLQRNYRIIPSSSFLSLTAKKTNKKSRPKGRLQNQ